MCYTVFTHQNQTQYVNPKNQITMNTKLAELRYLQDEGRYRQIINEVMKELKEKSEVIRKQTLKAAEALGTRETFLSEAELKDRITHICGEYKQLKKIIGLGFSPNSQGHIGRNDASRYNSEIKDLELRLGDMKNKRSLDLTSDMPKPEELEWYEPLIKWMPLAMLIGDALWEAAIFRLILGSFLYALPFAIVFGVAKYFLLKFVAKKLSQWQDRWKKITLVSIVMGIASIIFNGLGLLRASYLERTGEGVEISPVIFMLISIVIFAGALACEAYALSKKPEIQEKQAKLRDYEEIQNRDAQIERLDGEIREKKAERDRSLQLRIKNMDSADTFFSSLKDEYESTVAEFKMVYLQFRAGRDNGVVPDYFKNIPIPDVIDPEDWSILKRQSGNTNPNEKIEDHEN